MWSYWVSKKKGFNPYFLLGLKFTFIPSAAFICLFYVYFISQSPQDFPPQFLVSLIPKTAMRDKTTSVQRNRKIITFWKHQKCTNILDITELCPVEDVFDLFFYFFPQQKELEKWKPTSDIFNKEEGMTKEEKRYLKWGVKYDNIICGSVLYNQWKVI